MGRCVALCVRTNYGISAVAPTLVFPSPDARLLPLVRHRPVDPVILWPAGTKGQFRDVRAVAHVYRPGEARVQAPSKLAFRAP